MKTMKNLLVAIVGIGLLSSGALLAQDKDSTGSRRFDGFSGQKTQYVDDYNGFKIKVPVEFSLHEKGLTTDWTGPILDGGAASFFVNVVEMKGVPSKTLYDINLKSYKEKREYTDVTPVRVKFGRETALAFRCKEADNTPGTRDLKAADDIHRWHLFIFGNQKFFTCGFAGMFASFRSKKVQAVFEEIIQSVELIPTKP